MSCKWLRICFSYFSNMGLWQHLEKSEKEGRLLFNWSNSFSDHKKFLSLKICPERPPPLQVRSVMAFVDEFIFPQVVRLNLINTKLVCRCAGVCFGDYGSSICLSACLLHFALSSSSFWGKC